MKTAVLGTGSWGTALAQVLSDNNQETVLWGISPEQVNDINENHRNSAYFSDLCISERLHASTDIRCIEDCDILLLAVPSIALQETIDKAVKVIDHPVIIINVAKGFHPVTHQRLSMVIEDSVPVEKLTAVVSLIGPSHAEEVIQRMLTVINAVSEDEKHAEQIQTMFSNDYFRVYRNTDVTGAEIGVAVKNIMALASGVLTGIGQGDNARAALMTRGLAEMSRFGVAFGGKRETYLGLDGVGDLIVTCTSRHSRNFMAGYEIGKSGSAEEFLANNKKTVEGIQACKIVHEEAHKRNISMPITDEVYAVLYEGKRPDQAIQDLMNRDLKSEFH
ncbi:MAG: NAD(P)-dependent glycerol-3-phosphate dehydrogenase [Erysipelotrichia bacterium]|nr:NAD(P)-dependent glycerol-3-phosphate dehydrogenase [Erysipelotrichia bacterium]